MTPRDPTTPERDEEGALPAPTPENHGVENQGTEIVRGFGAVSRVRISPSDPAWPGHVRNLLRLGYGVEDIAVMLGCRADSVRFHVRHLRAIDRLAALYEQPKPIEIVRDT